jgi:hypothetical protein
MSASNSTYESRVPRRGPESIPPRNAIAASIAAAGTGAMRTECRVETCSGTPLSCAFSRWVNYQLGHIRTVARAEWPF